jgi:hypothetical protein
MNKVNLTIEQFESLKKTYNSEIEAKTIINNFNVESNPLMAATYGSKSFIIMIDENAQIKTGDASITHKLNK